MDTERIVCAANYYDDGNERVHSPININTGIVICGLRHHNCISIFAEIFTFPYSETVARIFATEIQGFMTTMNRFVDRREAFEIAKNAGQLLEDVKTDKNELYSEDMY